MIEMISGKKISIEKVADSKGFKNYYSFKDVCDLLDVESKERSSLGRRIRFETIKIAFKNKNGTIKDRTYVNLKGVVILCELSERKDFRKIIKKFKNYESVKISFIEKILKKLGIN